MTNNNYEETAAYGVNDELCHQGWSITAEQASRNLTPNSHGKLSKQQACFTPMLRLFVTLFLLLGSGLPVTPCEVFPAYKAWALRRKNHNP